MSTLAFTVCFAVWMMFGVIGIPIKKTLGLNNTEFGILTAVPVLTGSLIRVPLGMWTDKGIVGLAGGLGGFVLPIMFGVLLDLTDIRTSAFMLMYGVVWVSLIWMYWTEVRRAEVLGPRAAEFSFRAESTSPHP